jgi:hypothetical protein
LAEIAFTATLISRPLGSGFTVSKSISESASSTGSDFLYPTAYMPDGLLCDGSNCRPPRF